MTFSAYEASAESGSPIELYDFMLGAETFRFCSCADAVSYDGNDYEAVPIARREIKASPDERIDTLAIALDSRHAFVRKYINSVPGVRATMTLRRVHRFDTDDEMRELFRGGVRSVAFTEDGRNAEIVVMPLTGVLSNSVPRFRYSSLCNHSLFDSACGVAAASFKHSNTVSLVDGDEITVTGLSAKGDGWATGGFVQTSWGDYRMVLSHTGSVVKLLLPFAQSPIGVSVDVYAGCARDIGTCHTKFANRLRHGGYAYIPLSNPFTSGLA